MKHTHALHLNETHARTSFDKGKLEASCLLAHLLASPVCRYEQYELERAQLREMMGRNKAEIEAMAAQHAEEVEVRVQQARLGKEVHVG